MPAIPSVVYADEPETILYNSKSTSSKEENHVLMGTWLEVLQEDGSWYQVKPRSNRGKGGWVRKSDTRTTPVLKLFVVDVGRVAIAGRDQSQRAPLRAVVRK